MTVLFLWAAWACGQKCCAQGLSSDSLYAERQSLIDELARATNEMEYHPDSADLRLKKAGLNLQLEQWQKAKDEYDRVLRMEPQNVAALYFRAYANERLRRYAFARLDYEEVLRLVPGNYHAMLGLALLNQKDQHFTEAYNQLNLMVGQFPDSAVVYVARAGVENERGMKELAEYDYSEALRLEPDHADWLLARADLRMDLGRWADAADDLARLESLGVSRGSLASYFRRLKKHRK